MPADVDELVVRVADVCTYKWDMLEHRPFAFFLSAFCGGAFVVFGSMLALFLILYGIFRFLVEFVREPDPQLGQLLAGMTMGQLLSLAMLASGILLWLVRKKAAGAS
jgi:prolipoprotein diacylglyceryltransferase